MSSQNLTFGKASSFAKGVTAPAVWDPPEIEKPQSQSNATDRKVPKTEKTQSQSNATDIETPVESDEPAISLLTNSQKKYKLQGNGHKPS